MAKAKDIRFDDSGDLFINAETGDFEIIESDTRHVQDIIEGFAGWWKEFPLLGVGIKRFIASSGSIQRISRLIKIQLSSDGYDVDSINVRKENIYVTGRRRNVNL